MSKKHHEYNTPWRKTATAIYKKSIDGRIYGTFEVEMDAVLDYIKMHKEKGTRITITQIAMAAIGRAIALDVPDVNVYVKRGNIVPRDNIGIYTAVMKAGSSEMGGFVLRNVEDKGIFDITKEMDERVAKSKKADHEEGASKSKEHSGVDPLAVQEPDLQFCPLVAYQNGQRNENVQYLQRQFWFGHGNEYRPS